MLAASIILTCPLTDDINNDPQKKGNQIFDLLTTPATTPTASESTVPHYAALIISAPYPHLSTDCLPEFNAQAAHNAGVFNTPQEHPFLNPSAGQQKDWLLDPDKPPQSDQNAAADSSAWQNLRSAWLAAPLEEGQAVADLYASALGWDVSPPAAAANGPANLPHPPDSNVPTPVIASDDVPIPVAPLPLPVQTWMPLQAVPPRELLKVNTKATSDGDVGTGLLEVYYLSVPGFARKWEGFGAIGSPVN